MEILLLLLGAIGHMVLWVALINRVHAFGIPRRWVNWLTIFFLVMLCFAPIAVAAALYFRLNSDSAATLVAAGIAWGYVIICAGLAVISATQRLTWTRHTERRRLAEQITRSASSFAIIPQRWPCLGCQGFCRVCRATRC